MMKNFLVTILILVIFVASIAVLFHWPPTGYNTGGQVAGAAATPTIIVVTATPSPSPLVVVVTPTPNDSTKSVDAQNRRASDIANEFYSNYVNCLKNNSTSCDYRSSGDIDPDSYPEIDAAFSQNYDPIICGQKPPNTVRVDRVNAPTDGTATVYMIESYGSMNKTIAVNETIKNNLWMITSIACPSI